MLMELWERLRGYDKWIQTEAKIAKADMQQIARTDRAGNVYYTYESGDELTWTDSSGETQYADFKVSDDSPLYQLVGGEKVAIRYNPSNPSQYYYPDLLRARFVAAGRKAKVFSGLLLLFAFIAAVSFLIRRK